MLERIVFGLVIWLVLVGYLAFRRHYQWQNLIWVGGSFGPALLVLAYAFEGPQEAPLLFMLGAGFGALMQYGVDAEKRRPRTVDESQAQPSHSVSTGSPS